MSFNEVDNQQQIELDPTDNQPSKSCGAILFAERKLQNLSIEQISKDINLSATQIRALESDKYDILASASYVKGYIRLYANLLGLNIEEVLQYFKEPVQSQNASLSNIGRGIHKTRRGSNSYVLKFLLYLGLILSLCTLGWFVLSSSNWGLVEQVSIEIESQHQLIDKDITPEVGIEGKSVVENKQVSVASVVEPSIIEPSIVETPATGSSLIGKQHLAMTFSDSAWVEVIDKHNQQAVNKRYQFGETLSVYVAPPLRIFISNVDAVNMQYNQLDYDLALHRQGVFAKFILNKL